MLLGYYVVCTHSFLLHLCRFRAQTHVFFSFFSWQLRLVKDLRGSFFSSWRTLFSLLFKFCSTWEIKIETCIYIWILYFSLVVCTRDNQILGYCLEWIRYPPLTCSCFNDFRIFLFSLGWDPLVFVRIDKCHHIHFWVMTEIDIDLNLRDLGNWYIVSFLISTDMLSNVSTVMYSYE